ncbi:MAG TPA: CBS domain-containing protein [Planctomycetota bacterium]|nr:CBS domain-containing protein [Planctomycetota bacterium]
MTDTLRDIMTRTVETAAPETTVRNAAQTMKTLNIGSLPVCEGKRVIGMVTDRDIAIRCVAEGRDFDTTRVRDIMSSDVVSVREDSDLTEAGKLMHDRQLRRLPVLNAQGELVGYLSMARLARTQDADQTGRVLKGVSEASTPAPMGTGRKAERRQKTG